ncbi:hypothetical protein WN51_03263 [Melipona quadrifasciata]|uniref:Uncharacterized protein n=1 Tax=Melipona quadrifasciata TaxID=166423 RepID=A0A0N0BER6_9HYME|nr:hypothetical protein WN51_03263 [Melipona quadrifasciata]
MENTYCDHVIQRHILRKSYYGLRHTDYRRAEHREAPADVRLDGKGNEREREKGKEDENSTLDFLVITSRRTQNPDSAGSWFGRLGGSPSFLSTNRNYDQLESSGADERIIETELTDAFPGIACPRQTCRNNQSYSSISQDSFLPKWNSISGKTFFKPFSSLVETTIHSLEFDSKGEFHLQKD